MAYALVKFYEEDTWEVIPVCDLQLEEHDKQRENLEGVKTIVLWEDTSKSSRGKGKTQTLKAPAEVIKVSGWF